MHRTRLGFLVFIILYVGICGVFSRPLPLWGKEGNDMTEKKERKVLFVVAHKDFRDEEFLEPKAVLEKAGFQVTVASSGLDTATGMLGMRYTPDLLLSKATVGEYEGVVFIGGAGAKEYWDDQQAHTMVREAVSSGKVVGAICIAPVTLARAGVLKGKKVTVFSSVVSALTAEGAQYTGKKVERDGLLITASGPEAAKEFGSALAEALSGH
ncbi:MAG: DJ-1/PfpI family protein [bacterium]